MLEIKSLIDYEDEKGQTLLFHAVEKNDLKMIKELIQAGANVNHVSQYDTLLTLAYRRNRISLINDYFYSIRNQFEDKIIQSLVSVVDNNHLDLVEKFNLNLNRKVYMPLLHKATQEGNVELVKNLIKQGVDINLENKDGMKAPFFMNKKLKTQTIIDLLEVFKNAGFNFSYQNEKGKTLANHLLYTFEGKKKIAQYVEVYKLPINYFATISDEYLNQHCFFNESLYVKEQIKTNSEFFKNQVFNQINHQNIDQIDISMLPLLGNNSIFSLLEFMKNNQHNINTNFTCKHYKSTLLEKVSQNYLSVFNHHNYSFTEKDEAQKIEWKKQFELVREKFLEFKDLDLNQLKEIEFNGKTSISPLYFNACILYYLQDYIVNNIEKLDLTLRSTNNSTVINHCINQENSHLITLFLKQGKIDYNQLNDEGANLVLEVAKILNRENFKRLNSDIVSQIIWDTLDNCPFIDLKLKDKKGNHFENQLSGLFLVDQYKNRQEEIEKKWLDLTTIDNQKSKKIKL